MIEASHPSINQYDLVEYDSNPYYSDPVTGQYRLAYARMENHLTPANSISQMNIGYGIINHIDHSSQYEMAMGSVTHAGTITTNNADNLSNGNKYSIVYTAGFEPGGFDYDCIGEHFSLNSNGGAVAFIGPSRSIYTTSGNNHDKIFFQSLFEYNNFNIRQTLA